MTKRGWRLRQFTPRHKEVEYSLVAVRSRMADGWLVYSESFGRLANIKAGPFDTEDEANQWIKDQ